MGPNQIDVNNLNLTSNNGNVELVNQQVNVAQNMNVKADDFIVRAGKSTFESENSSRSSGAGVSFNPLAPITPANFTPSVNYSQSNGNMEGTTYNNSHITVGGNTTINTTGDMILSGADLVTNTIDGNIGGQLVIESLQDTVTGSNSGFGANISLPTVAEKKNAETGKDTPAHRSPTVGGSVTDGSVDKAWTSDQSSLIAKNGGTINVGSTTTVTGAVVVSENVDKPLIINTTELITNNLEDSDESTNTTIGFSGISESTPVPKTQYTYDNTDKEQSTLATMSNVVVNTGSGQVDLASKGINTDISKAQEVTKDEETHIDIPIPTDLLNSDTWKEFSNQFQQLIATPGDIIEGVQAALSDGSGTTTIDGHKLTTTNLTPYEEIKNNIIGTNAGISCSQSEACKNYEKLIEKYELPDGTYMNGYINPITNEYVPGITDVAAGALRIILTEAGKGDYAIKFVAAGDTMGQAKINDDTKTMIVNLSKMDITDLEQVTNVGVHESQRFTYENKDTDDKSLNNSDPKDEMYTFTPSIIDPNGIISGDTAWYNSTDLSGYRDKRNEGAEYRKANLLITNRLDGNGSTYNKSEISNQLKSIFGVEIDWIKYSKNEDYREKMNYYFFQAKYTIRLKSVDNFYYDGKTGNTYVTITQDNGKKMTLKELPEKESIFHNVTYKANGDIFIDFSASNLKFVQDDGYELVLKKEGEKYVQVVDQSVKGTYNYYSYGPDSKNIVDKFLNHPVDIKLWELYGGGPSDKSTFDQRKKIEVKALEIALYYDYYKKKYGSKMVNIDDINIF
ncbi:MAG: hemagglutinin repeat-containing protein [Leptotrichiaceae bacterium]